MKKIGIALALFILVFVQSALAGVVVYYDFQEGRVSPVYVKFTYEFGIQLGIPLKQHRFLGWYKVKVLEQTRDIVYPDRIEKGELVILVVINQETEEVYWVRVKDLTSDEKIKIKAKELSNKVIEKLKELETQQKR